MVAEHHVVTMFGGGVALILDKILVILFLTQRAYRAGLFVPTSTLIGVKLLTE